MQNRIPQKMERQWEVTDFLGLRWATNVKVQANQSALVYLEVVGEVWIRKINNIYLPNPDFNST